MEKDLDTSALSEYQQQEVSCVAAAAEVARMGDSQIALGWKRPSKAFLSSCLARQ